MICTWTFSSWSPSTRAPRIAPRSGWFRALRFSGRFMVIRFTCGAGSSMRTQSVMSSPLSWMCQHGRRAAVTAGRQLRRVPGDSGTVANFVHSLRTTTIGGRPMREAIAGRYVGTRVNRVEDPRLLTGHGHYVDDVDVPEMAHATFVRSPLPQAEIRAIDVAGARRVPGVFAVFTGAEMAALTNPMFGMVALPGLYNPVFHALATDRVRFVGDPVALVIASSRYVAEDAANLVEVEYAELAPVATM